MIVIKWKKIMNVIKLNNQITILFNKIYINKCNNSFKNIMKTIYVR